MVKMDHNQNDWLSRLDQEDPELRRHYFKIIASYRDSATWKFIKFNCKKKETISTFSIKTRDGRSTNVESCCRI